MTDTTQQQPSAILESLRAAILRLAVKRAMSDSHALEIKIDRAAFEASIADKVAAAKVAAAEVIAAEGDVRILTEAAFHAGEGKKPAAGVEVKLMQTVAITDAAAALAWAQRTELCLVPPSLDVAAVTALAKAGQVLPFVTISEVPRVSIASDLLKALEMAKATDALVADRTPAAA